MPESTASPPRLVSLDAYRGFVMLLMVSGGFGVSSVAERYPDSSFWRFMAYQLEHVEWTGCALWDLIQPSFFFIVGVAMPFSVAVRRARGDSWLDLLRHALVRSMVLVTLGVFLYSVGHQRTNFTFVNVLAQIGLGYTLVFLLVGRGLAIQSLAMVAILAGTWFLFNRYPVLTAEQAAALGLPPDWNQFLGRGAHWNKHANVAGAFDRWFLNLFRRTSPFIFNGGGYQTLNFIPSMANMLLGVMAGELLASGRSLASKRNILIGVGLVLLAIPLVVDHTLWPKLGRAAEGASQPPTVDFQGIPFSDPHWSIGPAVKKIWTPTFAVFSAGWTFLLLALFYQVIEGWKRRAWAFPFIVVGMNSITIYLLDHLADDWISQSLQTHFGQGIFAGPYGKIIESASVLLTLWLFCYWLYRQKVFIRI